MSNQSNRKCKCGSAGNGKCRNCSKIRMAIMLKNGYKNLGLDTTWFSFYNKNNQQPEMIIAGMLQRFNDNIDFTGAVNQVRFYDNKTNHLLKVEKL